MKIETGQQSYVAALEAAYKKTTKSPTDGAAQSAKPDSSAYSVHFSAAVEQMNTPVPEEDAIRRQKVDSIRQQLGSGTYNLSGRDVADKILNSLIG